MQAYSNFVMSRSTRSDANKKKIRKYLYAVTCWSCRQQFAIGYAWLKSNAQVEDLRNEAVAKGNVGHSEGCHNFVNGHLCGAANHITPDVLEFANEELLAPERLGDALSWR